MYNRYRMLWCSINNNNSKHSNSRCCRCCWPSLLQQGQQQPAAAPPQLQQVQQPQNNLVQQLQQQLLLHQLTAAAAAQPAAGASGSSLATLVLLLQQQQQLTSVLTSTGGGNVGVAAQANPLMQLTNAVLHQSQQSQQQEQNLLQQRALMEILNNQQSGGNERPSIMSSLASNASTSRDTGLGGLTSLTRPQPIDISQQSSSRNLLQQLQQQGSTSAATTTNPVQPLTHPPPMIRGNSGLDQARAAQAAAAAARAAAVPQANLNDPSSVETRIQRLIKQNEEILEPAPVLLKRRPYHRALGAQASIDNDSNHSGSSRTSPGITPRFPPPTSRPLPPPTTRSQSLFELGLKPSTSSSTPIPSSILPNGSLTSGQPMNRGLAAELQHMFMTGVEPSCSRTNEAAPECPHCKLRFPNESTREAHQDRLQQEGSAICSSCSRLSAAR
ncbi:hypothetical protein PENTCL1PPCAC_26798 [Pristionchus entomophagus]|uniref:Fumarylacetoacetase n=1 Tax=Pristionchus entomophagus TaxID=358040 RepID=A0AAV5UCE8_9BILA|nr:hypothetical protein PENTCL1PPCAC_26798 [Pristionchus entomophagus]